MVTRRTAKSKGNQFEYDCQHSLKKIYPDIYLTKERGFQMQYDLMSDKAQLAFECKRLKSASWNQLKEFCIKLIEASGKPLAYLLIKTNRQPCLVFFYSSRDRAFVMMEFEDHFGVPFEKHPSTRNVKKDD